MAKSSEQKAAAVTAKTDKGTPKGAAPQKAASQKGGSKKRPDNRSALSKLRGLMPVLVILACAAAFVAKVPLGNISSFGWEAISAICPMGALSVLVSSKTLVPRVLVSLVVSIALIVLFGRAFCSWVCTVPLVQRILNIRSASKEDQRKEQRERERRANAKTKRGKKASTGDAATPPGLSGRDEAPAAASAPGVAVMAADARIDAAEKVAVLSDEERADIAREAGAVLGATGCASRRARVIDSRHIVLGGGLLSAAIFGFPVFCLVCPIGLSFATVYLVLRMFTGQVSWALVLVPLMLAAELLLFKKWCYKVCPVGALMSLVGLGNKTFRPHIDRAKCIVTAKGKSCGRCNVVCPEGIDLHDAASGEYGLNDCIKCRRCVDACPTKAVSLPFLPPKE